MGKVIQLRPQVTCDSMPDYYESLPHNSRGKCMMQALIGIYAEQNVAFSTLWELLPAEIQLKFLDHIKKKQIEYDFNEVLQ